MDKTSKELLSLKISEREWASIPFPPVIKTLINIVISRRREDVKLFFMGTKRPFPESENMTPIANKAVNLSKELNLFDRSVFFNNGWVPYHERHNYLLETDIGITTYEQTLETHFSYRTRILDYLWAEVPVVCNEGDSLSEMIYQKGLGILLHDSNEKQLADIILYFSFNYRVNKI
ncbi:MAG: hypothetical protein Q7J85_05000 [Bacillota bacterium]|nr:hypothetical protein [Bacillota bacterium]